MTLVTLPIYSARHPQMVSWCIAQACIGPLSNTMIWLTQMLLHEIVMLPINLARHPQFWCHDVMRKHALVPLAPPSPDLIRCFCMNSVMLPIDLALHPELVLWCSAQACISAFSSTVIWLAQLLFHAHSHAANWFWRDILNWCHNAMRSMHRCL